MGCIQGSNLYGQRRALVLAAAISIATGFSGRADNEYTPDQAEIILLVLKQIPAGTIQPDGLRAILRPIMANKGLTKGLSDRIDGDAALKGAAPFVKALLMDFNGANGGSSSPTNPQPPKTEPVSALAGGTGGKGGAQTVDAPQRSGGAEAKDQKPPKPESGGTDSKTSAASDGGSMWQILMWSGAKLQNPYSIVDGKLKPGNTQTDGFIDLQLMHRYVLDENAGQQDPVFFGQSRRAALSSPDSERPWDWFVPLQLFPDLDFRMGYVYTGASSPTNLTIANISGGSDIYSESTVGIPFWRWSNSSEKWKQQATIELSGGFVSDKRFIALHPSYFVGVGYQFHKSAWTWQTRFGVGGADVPRLSSGSTVALDSEGLPIHDLKAAPSWGTLITYQLSPALALQLGANAFFETRSTWNIAAGLSVDPGKLFDKLKGGATADAPKPEGGGK